MSERSKALVCRFILCSSVSNFGTQSEHNFRKRSTCVYQTQFREEVTVKFVENAGKETKQWIVCSLESSTALIKSSLTTDGRPLRGSSCTFSRLSLESHPSPYHWITHGMFSIHLTELTMYVSRIHVSCIQETDYRPHFTCGGLLDFLEHFKHTGRCVNVVLLSKNCVRTFQTDQQILHACAP
jgi:hypothetical protein